MNKKFIILMIANIAVAFARPLVKLIKTAEQQLISTSITTGEEETQEPNKLIVGAFIVAATVAVGSLIALAFAMRKIKALTKKYKKAPLTDMEAQAIPPPATESVSSQAYFMGQDEGNQTCIPTFLDVATQKGAVLEAPTSGTFAERIGAVTRVNINFTDFFNVEFFG